MTASVKSKDTICQEALDALVGKHHASINASVGIGKTKIGLAHMQLEYRNGIDSFIVVGPKKAVFETWKQEAEKHGYAHLLKHIRFSTYLSLSKQDSNDCSVVYLDEYQNLTEKHDFWLSMFGGKIIGLSGTPPQKGSDKDKLVQKYCPIVYTYITEDAIEDNLLNDYRIYVHKIPLDARRNIEVKKKAGGSFYVSEQSQYDYWCDRLNKTFALSSQKILRVMRMKALMGFKSKEHYAKQLLTTISDKCLVFCNTMTQADRICKYSYHSKNPKREDNLEMFKQGTITEMSSVLQLIEGINIPDLKQAVILHTYSGASTKLRQRLGRVLRLKPTDTAVIHILVFSDTCDEQWVEDALSEFDQDKIFLYET